jgi:hypothetical protein
MQSAVLSLEFFLVTIHPCSHNFHGSAYIIKRNKEKVNWDEILLEISFLLENKCKQNNCNSFLRQREENLFGTNVAIVKKTAELFIFCHNYI